MQVAVRGKDMAEQRRKSLADIRRQYARITETYYNRGDFGGLDRVRGIVDRYQDNILNTKADRRYVQKQEEAMNTLHGYALMDRMDALYAQRRNRQYSRSTYMGGVRRASGGKG